MDYYISIKELLINNELTQKAKDYSKNKSDLNTYYEVGKLLSVAGKHYGEGIVKEYSKRLINEVGKKYDVGTLWRMRQFYYMIEKVAPLERVLSWSHYKLLIPLKDSDKIKYYIIQCKNRNLSKRDLEKCIKNKEYERLDENTRNKIINNESVKLIDTVKNPILIKNAVGVEDISERMLQKLILEDIPSFLDELGEGYCFIKMNIKLN